MKSTNHQSILRSGYVTLNRHYVGNLMKITHFKLPVSSGNTLVLDTGCIGMKCVGFVEGLGYEATQSIQYSLVFTSMLQNKN